MPDSLVSIIDELKIELVIGYGSAFTGEKRGLFGKNDLDLIIVTNFFNFMSGFKRRQIIRKRLGRRIDSIPLTIQEYKNLIGKKQSIVNIALKEGKILYDRTQHIDKRISQER
jgi:hypothetical protein